MSIIRPNEPPIDTSKHLTQSEVDAHLAKQDTLHYTNTVAYLVARQTDGSRISPPRVTLDPTLGVIEDRWHLDEHRSLNEQIAAMNSQVALWLANTQSLTLFGDALFLDIDLSESALPVGSRLSIGDCILEVTGEPHLPCSKFRRRFGQLAFKTCLRHKHLNLRGVYLRVLHGGTIALADSITVLPPQQ